MSDRQGFIHCVLASSNAHGHQKSYRQKFCRRNQERQRGAPATLSRGGYARKPAHPRRAVFDLFERRARIGVCRRRCGNAAQPDQCVRRRSDRFSFAVVRAIVETKRQHRRILAARGGNVGRAVEHALACPLGGELSVHRGDLLVVRDLFVVISFSHTVIVRQAARNYYAAPICRQCCAAFAH